MGDIAITCPRCGHEFHPKSEVAPVDNPKSEVLDVTPNLRADDPKFGDDLDLGFSSSSSPKARGKNKTYSPKFEAWWAVYPRHEDKWAAASAFQKALLLVTEKTLFDAAARYRDDPNRDPAFTKHGATWLNNRCWENDSLPSRNGKGSSTSDRIRRMIEEEEE